MPREVIFNDAALRELLHSPHGDVARDLGHRAARVEGRAKIYATGVGSGPRVRTGKLRISIRWVIGVDAQGLHADIGSDVEYALYVERGTRNARPYPYLVPALPAGR